RRAAEHGIEDTPLPAGGGGDDGDLLIFAAARSAWFTDYDSEQVGESAELNWGANDVGWRAAERASQPTARCGSSATQPRSPRTRPAISAAGAAAKRSAATRSAGAPDASRSTA